MTKPLLTSHQAGKKKALSGDHKSASLSLKETRSPSSSPEPPTQTVPAEQPRNLLPSAADPQKLLEAIDAFAQGGSQAFNALAPEDQRLAEYHIREIQERGCGPFDTAVARGSLEALGWEQAPPTITGYWELHQEAKPYPLQRQFMEVIFGPARFAFQEAPHICVAEWGQGAGKDFLLAHTFNLTIMRLLCLKDPARFFGRDPGASFDFVNLSFNRENAQNVFFREFKRAIRQTRDPATGQNWYEQHFGMKLKSGSGGALLQNAVLFPKNLTAHALPSLRSSAEGFQIFMAACDEFDDWEFSPGARLDSRGVLWASSEGGAKEILGVVLGNIATRFPRHGKLLIASYRKGRHTPLNYLLPALKGSPDLEEVVYHSSASTFEVNPTREPDSPLIRAVYALDPEGAALRFEGKLPTGQGHFYPNHAVIRSAMNPALVPPVQADPFIDEFEVGGVVRWRKCLRIGARVEGLGPRDLMPRGLPYRVMALDPGCTEAHFALVSGIALPPSTLDHRSSTPNPHLSLLGFYSAVRIDLVLEWIPEPDVPVDFVNVAGVVAELVEMLGVRLLVSDKWNSQAVVQAVERLGVEVRATSFPAEEQRSLARETRMLLENGYVDLLPDERLFEALSTCRLVSGCPESLPAFDHVKDALHLAVPNLARHRGAEGGSFVGGFEDPFETLQATW